MLKRKIMDNFKQYTTPPQVPKEDNQSEIKALFHTLWTKAVINIKDYDKKEWQKLADLLRQHDIEVQ